MPRSLSPIPASWANDDRIIRYDFLILYLATGTEYWTNFPGESYTKDIGNGEGLLVWDGTKSWEPGQFEQGDQDPMSVTDVTFHNADLSISDKGRAQGPSGFRRIRLDAWIGAYDKDDLEDFKGCVPIWSGVISRGDAVGSDFRLDLRPAGDPLSAKFPRMRFISAHGFHSIPKRGLIIKVGSTIYKAPDPTHSAGGAPPGGGGGAPPPGDVNNNPNARMPVVRVPRKRVNPTASDGPSRPDTRTVKR